VKLFEAAYALRVPMMLKGPTGCGKTRFVEFMAWRLGKPLITVACHEDMIASDRCSPPRMKSTDWCHNTHAHSAEADAAIASRQQSATSRTPSQRMVIAETPIARR